MARLWSSGFELNTDVSLGGVEFSGGIGTVSIQGTTVRSGSYAMQITSLSSGSAKNRSINHGVTTAPVYTRFYFRYATLPSIDDCISKNGSANGVGIKLTSTGTLKLFDEDGTIGSASSAMSSNTWYRIEYYYDTTGGAGTHIAKARLDGTEFAASTTRTTSSDATTNFGANLLSEANTAGDWYFDDIAINDNTGSFQNSYPGAGSIVHLRPSAAGDNTSWTSTGTNWSAVSEVTPNDATSGNRAAFSGNIDDYNIDDTPGAIGSGDTINVVQVGMRFAADNATQSNNAKFKVRFKSSSGGTVAEGTETQANSLSTYKTNANANPKLPTLTLYQTPDATTLTKSNLDTSQIGVNLTVTSPTSSATRVSTIWALVDYTPATSGSISVSDTVTTSESVGVFTNKLYTSTSDSITTSESKSVFIVPISGVSVFGTDNVTVSESSTVAVQAATTRSISVSDTVTTSESYGVVNRIGIALPTVLTDESGSPLTDESGNPLYDGGTGDFVTVSESVSAAIVTISALAVSVLDTVTTTEAKALFMPAAVVVSDTVTISESATVTVPNPNITVSDTITTSEAVQLLIPTLNITTSDTVTTSESSTVSAPPVGATTIVTSETVTSTEYVELLIAQFKLSVSDNVTLTETKQAYSNTNINKTDTITTTESTGMFIRTIPINISELVLTSENTTVTKQTGAGAITDIEVTLSGASNTITISGEVEELTINNDSLRLSIEGHTTSVILEA